MSAPPPFSRAFHRSKRPFTRTDLLVILIVVLVSAGLSVYFWLPGAKGGEVVVYVENRPRYRFPLTEEGDFVLRGRLGKLVLRLKGGEARIVASSCPLKICIKMGAISRPGQSLVCLPNRVVVTIKGTSLQKEIDLITQ